MSKGLTEARIARLKWNPEGSTKQIHWDSSYTGLGVRVYKSGNKSYVMQYGDRTNRKFVALGPISEHTLTQAHAWWREQREKERAGIDLTRDKRKAQRELVEEINGRETLKSLVDQFIEDNPQWSDSHRYDCTLRGQEFVRECGELDPSEVTRRHVNDLHAKITDRGAPYSANRMSTFIRTFYDWLLDEEKGDLPPSFPNPAHRRRSRRSKKERASGGNGKNVERPRKRVLRPERGECLKLLNAADGTSNGERDGTLVRLYLLTGLRAEELLLRRWSDINWKERTMHIPAEGAGSTKNGIELEVPLCPRAIELLKGLRDDVLSINRNAQIFLTNSGTPLKSRQSWTTAWNTIRNRADLSEEGWDEKDSGLKIHDLRRSVATWLNQYRGRDDREIDLLLNHAGNQSVTQTSYLTERGRKLATMRTLVADMEDLLSLVEEGHETQIKIAEVDHIRTGTNGA